MKKLTILALTAVASAAFIFTGCPHTADDFKEGETFDLITYSEPYSVNWGVVEIPAASFANMTTTNNAQRITMEYELSEAYAMVRFYYNNPDSGWVNYDGKYYDPADDSLASLNQDGYAGSKTGVYIIPNDEQLARLKKEGLAIQIWGVKVSKVTATYIGEKAEKAIVLNADFTGSLDGTLSGNGKIVADSDDPTIDVLAITGTGKAPTEEIKDKVKAVYDFSAVADLSKKTSIKIVTHVKDVNFKNGYDEVDVVLKYSKNSYALTTEELSIDYNYDGTKETIPTGTIYNNAGKPEDQWPLLGFPKNALYYGVDIAADDKNYGIASTSSGEALKSSELYTDSKDNKLAILLYTDDDNYFIKYITTTGSSFPTSFDEEGATQTIKLADFDTVDPKELDSDKKELETQVTPSLEKIKGVKVFMNSCKGTLYIKSITFE